MNYVVRGVSFQADWLTEIRKHELEMNNSSDLLLFYYTVEYHL